MKDSIKRLLVSYPRWRPPLPEAHRARYLRDYEENRNGATVATGIARRLEAWMHRQVAAARKPGEEILELGAGTLNHLPYESGFARYDFVEPFEALWHGSPILGRTTDHYRALADVPPAMRYDRIVSIAVLEHLTELPAMVARSALLLAPGGQFQAGIPTEGGLLWGLAWRYGTGTAYRLRTGLPYAPLMRHEHVNSASDILEVTRYFFEHVSTRRFPLPTVHLSLYTYVEATAPIPGRCRRYLEAAV